MKKKEILTKFLLILIPLLFLWAGFNSNRAYFVNDPNYIYLMNALCICNGESVGNIHNPGTTVMQAGALTMAIMHLFSNPENESLTNHVIQDPEKFIDGIRTFFLILNTLILFIIGWIAIKKSKSLWLALLLQITTLLSVNILDYVWTKLSPEPLLFFITGVFVCCTLLYSFEKKKDNWKYVLFFSLIIGAGLGTKATFLPLTLIPLIIVPTVKKKMAYVLGAIVSFVLFTIPAIPAYKEMYFWFRNLISHSGKYGEGSNEIIDTNTFLPNIISILESNPIVAITTGFGILVLFVHLISKNKKKSAIVNARFLLALLLSNVFGILLVAKHFSDNHYLISILLLSGITLYFIFIQLDNIFNTAKPSRILMPLTVMVLLIVIGTRHPKKIQASNHQYNIANTQIDSASVFIAQNYPDYTPVNYYIFSLNKFTSLKFGNDHSRGRIRPFLKKMYPHTYFYEFSSNQYLNWNRKTNLEQIIEEHGNKILLLNGPTHISTIQEMSKRGFPIKSIFTSNAQNIYVLDTLKYTPPPKERPMYITKHISCNMERVTVDEQFLLGSNNRVFGSSYAASTDFSRSGSSSLKLNKSHAFAIDYKIRNVKAGETYEIDVWKKPISTGGILVVSSNKSKLYYQAQSEEIDTDDNGWQLLRAIVKIPPELHGKDLIINLWNPRRRAVYFDDLSIKKMTDEPLK